MSNQPTSPSSEYTDEDDQMKCDELNEIIDTKKLSKICHQLAHPEPKIRSKGFKEVGKFISNSNNIDQKDMKKLSIAIYYYLWSTDMPITQRQVSVKIAQLHHTFGDHRKSFSYFRGLFYAIAENWSKIDKARSDKILLFVRILFAEVLSFVCKSNYEKIILRHFARLVQDVNGISSEKAIGLTLHIIEVFIPEYKATMDENLSFRACKGMILPFVKLALGNDINIARHVHVNILSKLGDIFDNHKFLKTMVKKLNMTPNKHIRSLMEKTLKQYEIDMDVDRVSPIAIDPSNIRSVLKTNCKAEDGKNKDLKVVFNLKNNKITAFYKNQPPAKISSVAESVC